MQWLIDIITAKVMPPGTIILWSSAFDTIPDGWTSCDGTLGTPDLRGLFVMAAGNGHASGEVGGAITHLHSLVNTHTHAIPIGTNIQTGTGYNNVTDQPTKKAETVAASSYPPYHALVYIMKL